MIEDILIAVGLALGYLLAVAAVIAWLGRDD